MRHKWFPVLIAVAAGGWWLNHAFYARYHTLFHAIALLASALSIALWYSMFGGGSARKRRIFVGLCLLLLVAFFVAFRPVYNGDMGVYKWRLRFAKSADQSLKPLETAGNIADLKTTAHDYPGFLGGGYWAEVKDVELESDWKAQPPHEVWRHEIGAGWSGFAIVGDYAFTQEQRGEDELVTCYHLKTGKPVWTHADKTRFDPAGVVGGLGDIGPRATPTVVDDRVYTQGGTGIVNCLDARSGQSIWSHDTPTEFGATVTTWGKAGSPLIVEDVVVISIGAPSGEWESGDTSPKPGKSADATAFNASLVAFDRTTGAVRWKAGSHQASYASPVLANLAGERQIVVVDESWVVGHRASDGKVLWEHPWAEEHDRNASCSQPIPLDGDRLFLSKGYGIGCSLLSIKRDAAGEMNAAPEWQPAIKKVMKTKFSNVVLRDGFAYGLDDVLLECIDVKTGALKWRKRREPVFGHGQIMLIGRTILVLSETGELALVEATPDEYRELGSIQALDAANVTWNNPAFSTPYLLVRNAREVACYELPVKR